MELGLNGKIAMVGGASKGIGFNVARLLAKEGVSVSISSRNEAAIQAAKQQIEAETPGAQVLAVAADLSKAGDIDGWLSTTMERFGGVDLLFTNTGGPPGGTFNDFGDTDWQAAFDLLVMSVIRMTRGVYPSMQARGGGAIVMSTSSSVKEPIANLTLSTVLRASVSALAKSLANEWAGDRIRVNQIVPGRILTDRIRSMDQARSEKSGQPVEEIRRQSEATIPLKRIGDPEEYASGAVFLFSDAASYITGATLQVDGGLIRSVT
ncbi:MAG TPA: SDR family oxidoreductase [Thermomicrobiales bacterium]|nr:SDR family oxidoreductase [Thermomicrobiales bacterium]